MPARLECVKASGASRWLGAGFHGGILPALRFSA